MAAEDNFNWKELIENTPKRNKANEIRPIDRFFFPCLTKNLYGIVERDLIEK